MERFKHFAALGALALGWTAPAGAAETLKLGVHASFSGAAAIFAQGMQSAAELTAEDIKNAGGLKIGGKTYEIAIKAYDDKYKAQDAVTAMDRLIHEDNIRFVVGPLGSAAAVATRAKATEGKVITFTMGFTPRALGAEAPYAFRPVITTGEFTDPQLDWVLKQAPVKRVRALLPNDETGQQMGASGQKAYRERGVTLDVDYFERERVDFVPILTRILPQADALEIGGVAPLTTGLIIKQARELGFKGPMFVTGGDVTAEVVKIAGKAATEGVYIHIPLDPNRPETAAFIKRYREIRPAAERLHALLLRSPPDAGASHEERRLGRGYDEDREGTRLAEGLSHHPGQGTLGRRAALRHQPSGRPPLLCRANPERRSRDDGDLHRRGLPVGTTYGPPGVETAPGQAERDASVRRARIRHSRAGVSTRPSLTGPASHKMTMSIVDNARSVWSLQCNRTSPRVRRGHKIGGSPT